MKIAVQLEDGRNMIVSDSDRVGKLLLSIFNNVELITGHNPVKLTLNCKDADVRPVLEVTLHLGRREDVKADLEKRY